jgi:hypothetical protein
MPGSMKVDAIIRTMSDGSAPTAKVLFRVEDTDGSCYVETLWAFDLGNDEYQIDNSPFYAYSVSWRDVVHAPFQEDEGFPTFQRVVTKSGHRTVRVVLESRLEADEAHPLLEGLKTFGCTYEGAGRKYISVDVPPGVDLDAVRQYLIEQNATWEHADPTYAELFAEER